jgi:MFS family permease
MTLVGYGVLVGVPVISTAWVELLGFTEEQVGRVAGADLGGLSLGAIMVSLVVRRMNRRILVLLGIGLAVAANGLCMIFVDYDTVLWLRFAAGTGSGIYTAVAVATLGGSSKPARAYNLMLFAFAFSQAAEMHALPLLSMNGIYMVFIVCYAISIPFLRWIPPHPVEGALDVEREVEEDSGEHHVEHKHIPAFLPWLCLGAIFFTYINIGTYWAYIELASLNAGIDPSGGLLDIGAARFEPYGVGHDQLVGVALLFRKWRARLHAFLRIFDGAVQGCPATAQAERGDHQPRIAEHQLHLDQALALDLAQQLSGRDKYLIEQHGRCVAGPNSMFLFWFAMGQAFGACFYH